MSDLVGRQLRILRAVSTALAQNGVGRRDLIIMGRTISNSVRLRRSAMPLEEEEYAVVDS